MGNARDLELSLCAEAMCSFISLAAVTGVQLIQSLHNFGLKSSGIVGLI